MTAQVLLLDRCAAEVMGAFADHGVPVTIIKGPVIAHWLYDDGAPRPYHDIDLLVAPWAFERAEEVLAHLGFRPRHRRVGEPGQAIYASNWIRGRLEDIDLHFTVGEAGVPAQQVWDVLEPHRVPFRLFGADVASLDLPRRAMHAALHAAHHGITEAGPREDLRRAVLKTSVEDWSEAASTAAAIGASDAFAAGLRLDPEGSRIADQLRLVSSFSRAVELRIGGREDSFTLTIERVLQEPTIRRKVSYLWLHLLPPPARIREAYPQARRGPWSLALMYLWRPVRRLPASARALVYWMQVHNRTRPPRSGSHPGGLGQLPRVIYIGNFLHEHGLNPTYAESLVHRLRAAGIDVHEASHAISRPRRMLEQLLAVGRARRRTSLVIVDLYGGPRAFPAGIVAALACRVLRRRYIVALHGGSLPARLEGQRWVVRLAVCGATEVVAPSHYLADAFEPLVPVKVIANGIEAATLATMRRAELRPRLLFLRAYSREYGARTMIEAFAIVRGRVPDATLTMAGPDLDGSRAECEALAERLRLTEAVRFLPRVEKTDICDLLVDHDIFVNPTTVDNTPVTVVEAMIAGLCVVASDVGGLPALLDKGRLGLLVAPTAEAVADGIVSCLVDPDAALQRAAAAVAAAELMDWSRIVPEWVALLSGVRDAP